MPDQEKDKRDAAIGSPRVTRRTVIGGLMAAAVLPVIGEKAFGQAKPQTGVFTPFPPVPPGPVTPFPRQMHTATPLPGGYVLIAGGVYNGQILADAQLYHPNGTWTNLPAMTTPRAQHAAVLISHNRVLVLGGVYQGTMSDCEIYNSQNNTWTPADPMALPRYAHQATQFAATQILITGGVYQGELSDTEIYTFV